MPFSDLKVPQNVTEACSDTRSDLHTVVTCYACAYCHMLHLPAENGIAPTTPGRGKLAAPFKLVAPNADMKDIPATIVVRTHPGLGLFHHSLRH